MVDDELRQRLLRRGVHPNALAGLDDYAMIGLTGDLALSQGLDLTLPQLVARCGADVVEVRRLYDALGLDVDELAGFGDDDVALVSLAVDDASGIIDEVSTQLFRVAGTSLRRIAEAVVAAYVQDVEAPADGDGINPLELAELNEYASGLLMSFADTIGVLFRHHMWVAVRRQRAGQEGLTERRLIRMGLAFVDLVGFTPISRSLTPGELIEVIEKFEHTAFEVTVGHGGRVVKSIGDEVMVAAADHDTVAAIAVELVGTFEGHPSIQPRAGVSAGEVLFRLGDYYGPVVNLASRLADVAEPGEVLTDRHEPTSDRIDFTGLGQRRLKGFERAVPVWSIRPRHRQGRQV